MSTPVLSVVMPAYNEAATIEKIVKEVTESPWVAELLLVDDGSTDGTAELARRLSEADPSGRIRLVQQPRNLGKGAALRRGFAEATAPYVLVQDADLEYDPGGYGRLLEPLLDGRAESCTAHASWPMVPTECSTSGTPSATSASPSCPTCSPTST